MAEVAVLSFLWGAGVNPWIGQSVCGAADDGMTTGGKGQNQLSVLGSFVWGQSLEMCSALSLDFSGGLPKEDDNALTLEGEPSASRQDDGLRKGGKGQARLFHVRNFCVGEILGCIEYRRLNPKVFCEFLTLHGSALTRETAHPAAAPQVHLTDRPEGCPGRRQQEEAGLGGVELRCRGAGGEGGAGRMPVQRGPFPGGAVS